MIKKIKKIIEGKLNADYYRTPWLGVLQNAMEKVFQYKNNRIQILSKKVGHSLP